MTMRLPTVDVYEENDDVVIKAEIPGLSKEEISVQVTDSSLSFGAFSRAWLCPVQ